MPLARMSFVLVGWNGVLVPSLVREVEARFGVDDAGMGIWFFVSAVGYAASSFAGGLLTERLGRRVVLTAAAATLAAGLVVAAVAPSWTVFLLVAGPLVGVGPGAIDGGMNALVLAVSQGARGRALNLLHLFVAAGALTAPFVIGQAVGAGVPTWPVFLATAIGAAAIAIWTWLTPMPSGRNARADRGDRGARSVGPESQAAPAGARVGPSALVPLIVLAVAIGAYVAAEVGVSNWVVRFMADVPVATATLALSAFWAGLALGRLAAARFADRFNHATFAAWASITAGIGIVIALAAPTTELAILAWALAGFASGPVFPMIIAIGGELYPDRIAAATGTLTGSAVVGGAIYPPLMGFMSVTLGIGFGMVGAAVLSVVAGILIVAAARARAATLMPRPA